MSFHFTTRQRATLKAFVDTVVAAVDRPDDTTGFYATKASDLSVDVAVEQFLLERTHPDALAALGQLLDTAALIGMQNQPVHIREAIVRNLAGISPEVKAAIGALRKVTVMLTYGQMDTDGGNPMWSVMGYPGPRPQVPEVPKTLTTVRPTEDVVYEADVVVVGSGSGGGVAAAVLAQAGRRVIVVEAGGYHNESDFVQNELVAYQKLFHNGGFFPTVDGMVSIVAGGTVGGGSTVNWSNSLRTPRSVRKEWAEAGLTDATGPEFDAHLDAVFERLECNTTVAMQNGPHLRLADGAAKMAYNYYVSDLNISPARFDPDVAGYSGMGDVTGAKNGTMRTYLQDASDAGAELLPNTRIATILTADGAATGVAGQYTDPTDGRTHAVRINAPTVVVAAGTLETPALLLRSGIGGPAVGTSLRLHPTGLVTGIYAEQLDPWKGPAMAGVMDEFAESNDGYGYLIEVCQQMPGLMTSVLPWNSAADHKDLASKYRYRADWIVLVKDRGTGTTSIDDTGNAVHHYPFTDELDRRSFREGIETAIRMQEAAGAEQIFAAGQSFAPWRRGDDLEAFLARVKEAAIGPDGVLVFSAHQMCTAPLGADPATSVAKPSGELHDVLGVWIADASGMPTCSGVNPMISTMALARRTASNVLGAATG